MTGGDFLSRWQRRLRNYLLAFVPPPESADNPREPLKLDAVGFVRMFRDERDALFGRDI